MVVERTRAGRSEALALGLLFTVPPMFAANMLVARLVEGTVPPVALAFWRWFFTLMLLAPIVGRLLWDERRKVLGEGARLLVLGALGMGLCGAPVYVAAETTTALNIGLLYSISPLGILVLSALLYRVRLGLGQVAGALLGFAGVVVIVTKGDLERLVALGFTPGDLWTVLAVAAWSLYSVWLRQWRSGLGLFPRFAAIVLMGVLVNLPAYGVEAAVWGSAGIGWRSLGAALFLAVVPGLGAYSGYAKLVESWGANRAGLLMYLIPLYNAVLAYLVLGEQPGWYHLWGAALIVPGLYLSSRAAAG